jgi:uncharacterized protein YraI
MRSLFRVAAALAFTFTVAGCAPTDDIEDENVDSTADAITSSTAGELLLTSGNVNLRTGASTSSSVIRVLPAGTKVTSRGAAQGSFIPVTHNGTQGFVHGNYLVRGASGGTSGGTTTGSNGFIAMPWDGKHADTNQWNQYTADAIAKYGTAMRTKTPSDVASFCPNYGNLDEAGKTQFWIGLIAAMAKYESNYNPNTKYTENFDDSNGNSVISRGLLQLSYESAKAYGCDVSSSTALHDPKVNLTCTVRIINKWLASDGVISAQTSGWRGAARYWSVLRKSSTLGPIRTATKNLSVCK